MTEVGIKLDPNVELPVQATEMSAGYDLRANQSAVIYPGEGTLIGTGVYLEMPYHIHCEIRPRSGLATKKLLIIPNSPGTIDSDYRGEVKVFLFNIGKHPQVIELNDRIAQAVFIRHETVTFNEKDELNDTARGNGGFGSTGLG